MCYKNSGMCLNPLENIVQTTSFQWIMASSGFFLFRPTRNRRCFQTGFIMFPKESGGPCSMFFCPKNVHFFAVKVPSVLALNSYRWDEITPATSW